MGSAQRKQSQRGAHTWGDTFNLWHMNTSPQLAFQEKEKKEKKHNCLVIFKVILRTHTNTHDEQSP